MLNKRKGNSLRIVFMGTPDFSVPTLEAIYHSHHHIDMVITQPDKEVGRGKKISFSPIKEKSLAYGLQIRQPLRLRKDTDLIEEMRRLAPDVIVVIAFGQILPKEVLDIPRYGCLNGHTTTFAPIINRPLNRGSPTVGRQ